MKHTLAALASGAFTLGSAEFVMMGMLAHVAQDMDVSVPAAGRFISSYAVGVCVGTLILVFGRRIPPRQRMVLLLGIATLGNILAAIAPNPMMLILARFISGLPHGAFFGTGTMVAKTVSLRGKEAQSVAIMVTGMTVSNMLGVPAATMLASALSWRIVFVIIAVWACVTMLIILAWVPNLRPVRDTGLAGQFRFLRKPSAWLALGCVLIGNAGVFCWWSYVSPWLQHAGGLSVTAASSVLVIGGLGMVVGGMLGGTAADRWKPSVAAAVGQVFACSALFGVATMSNAFPVMVIIAFLGGFSLFFVSSPQQVLMTDEGLGGGELIGGASVQVAFNLGNALGSSLGGLALTDSGMNYRVPSIVGLPLTACAIIGFLIYARRYQAARLAEVARTSKKA